MLIQSSLPSSIEAAFSFVDHRKQDLLCDWTPSAETWGNCPNCNKHPYCGHGNTVPIPEGEINKKDLCSLDFLKCSQLSASTKMLEKSTPTFVYQRKKLQRNSLTVSPTRASANSKPSNGCLSGISSETPSVAAKENIISPLEDEMVVVRSPIVHPFECDSVAVFPNSGSSNGCSYGEDPGAEEHQRSNILKVLEPCCANDRCSSSKSNMDLSLAFLKIEGDDTAECSSSSALVIEGLQNEISEKGICISILRSEGLLEGFRPMRTCASAEESNTSASYSSRSCKVCDFLETTQKMLICDNCEEAFHLSCCNPRIKEIPVDDWFCQSCLKKKHKMLKQKISNSKNISSERGRYGNAVSGGDLGPIAFMLKGAEKYATGVQMGKEFQAEVSEWSGPIIDEVDPISEPLEINPSACESMCDWSSGKPSRLSSIGNWLQCRVVIEGVGEGVDGTICGKWRRAPLFEVQTENWECFCSVIWDPAHADCAVPQELDTDEVLKQLKYIETLRPRLAARKRKLGCSSRVSGQVNSQDPTGDVRNIETL